MGARHRLVQRARQVRAVRAPDVPSPCVSICRIDPATRWCEGCFRTLEEVAAWAGMADEAKREVWRLIEQRALAPDRPRVERRERQQEQP
ncbi:MAG TPA: DUF1289 domain-containing protein [Ramlibacter sp.]|nr:DUF1289 domain-containing protein [Ramlibacter sp.]